MNIDLLPAGTFMGVPTATEVTENQAAIIGVPFDCGTHPSRIGSRQGPYAIRQHSGLIRPHYPPLRDVNILQELHAADLGDVSVVCGDPERSFESIETAIYSIAVASAYPISMGGDGAVTLPQLRAMKKVYRDLILIHIDAHTDTYPIAGYNTASTFTRAAEENLVDCKKSFHVGARGTLPIAGVYDFTESLGYNLILGSQVRARGLSDVISEIRDVVGKSPVYLCFDMDYIDPSCAPGVATPTWGGPTSEEAFELLHGLAGLRIIAVDVNTVSPPHDPLGMTAFLAGTIMVIGMHLIGCTKVHA